MNEILNLTRNPNLTQFLNPIKNMIMIKTYAQSKLIIKKYFIENIIKDMLKYQAENDKL